MDGVSITVCESKACKVVPCENVAQYVCPRCRLPYCSVQCYRIHSDQCVQAFAKTALQPLRGVTTSAIHRKSFNDLLERLRHQPDDAPAASFHFQNSDTDSERDDLCESSAPNSSREDGTIPSPDHAGEHHVFEELLSSLDGPGRQALFTVLNSAVENTSACTPSKLCASPTENDATTSESLGNGSEAYNTAKNVTEVTDTLEMLVEEMETIDLSYEDILARLPDFLRSDFENRLRQGNFDRLVPVWTPWWQCAQASHGNASDYVQPPAPLPPLPSSDQLLVPIHLPRRKASLCLQYNLIDVLAAHALSMRLCNGEWWGDTCAAKGVWRVSTVLSKDSRYASVTEVCDVVAKNITREESHALASQSLYDVANILSGGGDWVSRALYECQNLLEVGFKIVVSSKGEVQKRLGKIGFFVSWSMCQESTVFQHLARKVMAFADLDKGNAEEVKVAARVVQASRTKKIKVLD